MLLKAAAFCIFLFLAILPHAVVVVLFLTMQRAVLSSIFHTRDKYLFLCSRALVARFKVSPTLTKGLILQRKF